MEKIRLPTGDEFYCSNKGEAHLLYKDLFEQRSYFRFDIRIGNDSTVMDVGANVGLFALLASREAAGVRVISLEPLPPLFSVLQANYELHKICGKALPYGAGRRSERANFTYYLGNSALSGRFADVRTERNLVVNILQNRLPDVPRSHLEALAERGLVHETYECEVKSLSAVFRESDITHVDLLKVDVEKAELDVLEGINPSDWQRIEQVVVEVHDIGGRLAQICELLRARGFEVRHSQGEAFAGTDLHDVFAFRRRMDR